MRKVILLTAILFLGLSSWAQTTYYSKGSLDVATAGNWNTATDGSGTDASSFGTNNTFIIQNGHSMTLSGSTSWSIGGTNGVLTIQSGGTWTNSSSGTVTIGTFNIYGGGKYINNSGSTAANKGFPGTTKNWANSNNGGNGNGTVEVQNQGSSAISTSLTYGNLIINISTGMTGSLGNGGNIQDIKGDLTVNNTMLYEYRLVNGQTSTLNIGGNLTISGGILNCTSGTGNPTVNVAGNVVLSGGTLNLGGTSSGIGTLNASGDFTISGGTLSYTGSGTAGVVNFSKSGTQNFNFTSGTITATSKIAFGVNSGSTLNVNNSFPISSTQSLAIAPGGAITGNYAGISGTVTLQQSFVGQRGWRVLANPFSTATTIATVASNNNIAISTTAAGGSGLTDSRTYDNSASPSVTAWANVTASSWAANTPYALFYRGTNAEVTGANYTSGPAGQTYNVSGTLNGASVSITPLVGDGTSYNLVGNPYAAPVNSQALTGGAAAPYYLHQISVTGTPQTKAGSWAAVLSSNTSTTIPVLGVVAYVPSSTTPFTVTAATDINTGGTVQTGLFGGANTTIKNVELVINNNKGEYQDKLFVRIGTDKNQLSKFNNDNVNFYTINGKNQHLAIDAREQLNTAIPLGISASAGTYTINVANNNIDNVSIYLKDKFTQSQTELTPG
ncbi:MAG: hypothetical protein JSR09_04005, partial [Bacteroidetes bacterium]|nr:hypothetical protein [Bacteroidota bacterium]